MKFIHLLCLKQWLASRLTAKINKYTTTYTVKANSCELCKQKFPERVAIGEKSYYLLDIRLPEKDYIILERTEKDKKDVKTMYLINFEVDKELRIVYF